MYTNICRYYYNNNIKFDNDKLLCYFALLCSLFLLCLSSSTHWCWTSILRVCFGAILIPAKDLISLRECFSLLFQWILFTAHTCYCFLLGVSVLLVIPISAWTLPQGLQWRPSLCHYEYCVIFRSFFSFILQSAVEHIFPFKIQNFVFLVEWRIMRFLFYCYTRSISLVNSRSMCIADDFFWCLG